MDWWDQARSVANSLVAEKGMALIASVKARATTARFAADSHAKRKFAEAAKKGPADLEALKEAYIRTINEIREYKMERDFRQAEVEALKEAYIRTINEIREYKMERDF